MKRNMLFALIALGLGGVSVAHAQDSTSWYLAPRLGLVVPDDARKTETSSFEGIGFGTWVNPNFAVDFEYGINNANFKNNSRKPNSQWENVQLDVAGRWFFNEIGSGWRPYLMGALGAMRHQAFAGSVSGTHGGGWDPMALIGVGMQLNMSDRLAFRGEIAARYDHDNNSFNSELSDSYGFKRQSGFTDGLVTVGLTYSFGHQAAPVAETPAATPPPPPPPPPPEHEQAVPPASVSIDLRGVEFKFDHPRVGEALEPSLKAPTADSVQLLNEAVDTLKRYPNVRVEVGGHTDSVGTEAYNQKLSDRRAKGVYDYLTSHGVDAGRLDGPKGYGETMPIDTNKTSAGRQRNRRVELKVEN
ncbi:MAG TPA: OmpA family protein [Rudaea sp.]|nr:OmpA family protein [Rudaea sp.]